jgi:hypothetical protein
VFLGLGVDAEARRVVLDIGFSAKEGTALAQQMALQQEAKTRFAGLFIPDASVTLHTPRARSRPKTRRKRSPLCKMAREQWAKQIDDSPEIPANKRGPLKNVLAKFFDVVEKTIDSGRIDGGASLVLGPVR